MRAIALTAAAVLALGACNRQQQAENSNAADQGLTADQIVTNDVTAIDAVTGDAANMAADVNYQESNDLNASDGNGQAPARAKRPTASGTSAKPAPSSSSSESSSASPVIGNEATQ